MKRLFSSTAFAIAAIALLFVMSCSSSTKPNKVSSPIITPAGGLYSQAQQVSIACITDGAEIRYTLDGSAPPTNSTVYTGPFEVPLGTTVKAIALKAGMDDSKIVQAFFSGIVPVPVITPESGTYIPGVFIRISIDGLTSASNWPEGTSVRYTLDGTEPDSTSLLYNFPFTLDGPCILRARAYHYNWTPGPVISTAYTIYPVLDILSTCDTPNTALGIAISGNYAYIADGNRGLQIIDITNPLAPFLTGGWDTFDYSVYIAVSGNYVYMGDLYDGVHIIDVSNPALPVVVSTLYTSYSVYAMAQSGDYVYACNMKNELFVFNVSNPVVPVLAGSCILPANAYGLEVSGNYLYAAAGESGLVVVDISNPANPVCVTTCDTYAASDVSVYGNYAYVTEGTEGLKVINISNPLSPYVTGSLATPYNTWNVTAANNDYIYVTGYGFDLLKVNVSNPSQPFIAAFCQTPDQTHSVAVSGNYIYVTDNITGLLVVEK